MWPYLDRNHDGKIDKRAACLCFREKMIRCGRGMDEACIQLGGQDTYNMFLKMDTNGDGKVTKEELTAFMVKRGLKDFSPLPHPDQYPKITD